MTNLKYLFVILLTILCPFASSAEDYEIEYASEMYIVKFNPQYHSSSNINIWMLNVGYSPSMSNGFISLYISNNSPENKWLNPIVKHIIAKNNNSSSYPIIIQLSNGKTIKVNTTLLTMNKYIKEGAINNPGYYAFDSFFIGIYSYKCEISGENVPESSLISRFFTLLRTYDIVSLTLDGHVIDLSGLNSANHINAMFDELVLKCGYDKNMGKKEIASDSGVTKVSINGHEYVDLGLPSGTKWATCNVGASSPEQYGSYFAWGETRPKTSYTQENSEIYNKEMSWLINNGYIDINGNLTLSHDAARQNWGETWRMPTLKEIKELMNNTTSEWMTQNGVQGRLIKSKINGKSIFLPACGWYFGSSLYKIGERGDYWTSTTDDNIHNYTYSLDFGSNQFISNWGTRYRGCPVRPVSE